MKRKETKLKTCPFCGSKKLELTVSHVDYAFVFCRQCQASGPTGWCDDEASVLWNQRKPIAR